MDSRSSTRRAFRKGRKGAEDGKQTMKTIRDAFPFQVFPSITEVSSMTLFGFLGPDLSLTFRLNSPLLPRLPPPPSPPLPPPFPPAPAFGQAIP